MTNIIIKPDCGNSPKMKLIKEINEAFANADVDFLQHNVTEDIRWNVIGDEEISGKEEFVRRLKAMSDVDISELKVDTILSHGKHGAANGQITMPDGKKYAFADIYEFENASGKRVKSMTSYVIRIH